MRKRIAIYNNIQRRKKMKHSLRLAALVLATVIMLSVISGCAAPEVKESAEPAPTAPETAPEAGSQQPEQTAVPADSREPVNTAHIVTDNLGNEVEVPDEINRIAIISTVPLASVFCMVEGSGDKLIGLTPSSKNAAVHSFIYRIAPNVADIDSSFAEGDAVNVEAVAALEPYVVFYNANNAGDAEAAAKLTELSIPCVAFSTTVEGGNTIETFNAWAALMGEIMQKQSRAEEIVAYGREVEAMVKERVAGIAESDRKSALIIGNYTQAKILGAGNTFGRYWLSTIGANNVAMELDKPLAPITLEQIYAWDPDVIFLNSFSPFKAEDILNSTAVEGDDWSGLTAVKNKQVYKMPLGVYYWFPPCSDSPLALQWLAQKLYPELFEDIDMDAAIRDYYAKFYGLELSDEDMATLYDPPAESAY